MTHTASNASTSSHPAARTEGEVSRVSSAPLPGRVDFMERAVEFERKARELDAAGHEEQALKMYTDCLNLFAYVEKKEQNAKIKQAVRERMGQLLDRAEVLKA